ncbi:MAG: glycosyltransferase family 4 protein [Candidatus Paceibacteria bacterium]
MPNKVALDARMMSSSFGIGRYIQQLVTHLEQISPEDMEFFLFMREKNWDEFKPVRENFHKIKTNIDWYGVSEQLRMPKVIERVNPDLVHFPHWNVPFFYSGNFVVTIHDLIMFHFPRPEATTHGKIKYWVKDKIHRFVVTEAIENSEHIITPSKFTKKDILDNFDIENDKLTVTYEAPFFGESEPLDFSQLQTKINIEQPYVFYVGSAYPHKNLNNLVKAWKRFKQADNNDFSLILAGKEDYFYDRLTNSNLFKSTPDVEHIGQVSDEQLKSLYKNAELFVFPSLYEGFGLPPLESLQLQTPVLASETSSVPEVLGEAGIYTDTEDVEQFSQDIHAALEKKEMRQESLQRAEDQLDQYSWKKLAKKTLRVYKNNS